MESDQVQMHQISKPEQSTPKGESVILRAIVANPDRHKPLAQHPASSPVVPSKTQPTTTSSIEPIPTAMYTLESRYRPIPEKVLPKQTPTKLYYINTDNIEEKQMSSPPASKEDEEKPILAGPEVLKTMEPVQEPVPVVFLEPKIISEPILYSIVGKKTKPVYHNQPAPVSKDVPSPIFYTITGSVRQPTINMSENIAHIPSPVIEKPVILYSIVGNPHIPSKIPESVNQVLSSPPPITTTKESLPILYSVIGSPHVITDIQEPVKQVSSVPQQSSASLYSIVGCPAPPPTIPQVTKVNPPSPPAPAQHVKVNPIQPVPILYTVVGQKQLPANIPKENQRPLSPVRKQVHDGTLHTVIGDPLMPQTMTSPHKTQPLQPHKQQQQQQKPPPQPAPIPVLYPLVGKPHSPSRENMDTRPKSPIRKIEPLPKIVPTRRRSFSRERYPEPETIPTRFIPTTQTKPKRQEQPRERTIPKSETIFIPLPEHERQQRNKKPRTILRHMSPGHIHHRPHHIPNHDPLRLPDYISPYAYYPSKPYREQTLHPASLPIITNHHSDRNSRPTAYEPRPRAERKLQYDPWTAHSLERYSSNTKRKPRVWDYENRSHTDIDDDINDEDSPGRKQYYRRYRLRTPWVPVW